MDKMWAGRFSKALDKEADDFNSSIIISTLSLLSLVNIDTGTKWYSSLILV